MQALSFGKQTEGITAFAHIMTFIVPHKSKIVDWNFQDLLKPFLRIVF